MIQPVTTSVCWVVRVVTHADDQLIMSISWAVSGSYLLMEAVRMYSYFNRKTQQPVKMFFFKGLYFVLFHFLCLSLYDVYLECLYKFGLTESFIEILHLYNFAYIVITVCIVCYIYFLFYFVNKSCLLLLLLLRTFLCLCECHCYLNNFPPATCFNNKFSAVVKILEHFFLIKKKYSQSHKNNNHKNYCPLNHCASLLKMSLLDAINKTVGSND